MSPIYALFVIFVLLRCSRLTAGTGFGKTVGLVVLTKSSSSLNRPIGSHIDLYTLEIELGGCSSGCVPMIAFLLVPAS